MRNENTQNLAEKIALLLQETESDDSNFFRESLEKINQRLDRIESQIAIQNPPSAIQNLQSNHSSQERFSIAEVIVDEVIAGLEKEKACPYEPTAKPCDHCAMCSSRGF